MSTASSASGRNRRFDLGHRAITAEPCLRGGRYRVPATIYVPHGNSVEKIAP